MSTNTKQGNSPKSGRLESVKYYIFNGEDEDKWIEYSIKTLAFAETKEWVEGLTDKSALDDMKRKAKNYLTLSLTGKAFKFLNCSKEPKDVWDMLRKGFTPMEDEDFYKLVDEFKRFKMAYLYGIQKN